MEKLKPNFTQMPNIILDELLSVLSASELKVLLYICRRTYGFHKQMDKISTSQLMNGIRDKDNKPLDTGTGLSNRSILDAIRSLEKLGIIKTTQKGTQTKVFSLDTTYEKSTQEIKDLLMKNLHKPYVKSTQVLMKNLHIQKKEKESIQNKVLAEDELLHKILDDKDDPVKISEVIKQFSEINPACKKMYGNTTQRQAVSDLIESYTYEKVISVIKFLPQSNKVCFWKATTPKQLWDNWINIENEITSKLNKELNKKNNII